jgi:hypothetical protein
MAPSNKYTKPELIERMDSSLLGKRIVRYIKFKDEKEIVEGVAGKTVMSYALSYLTGLSMNKCIKLSKLYHMVMRECMLRYGAIELSGVGTATVSDGIHMGKPHKESVRRGERSPFIFGNFRPNMDFKRDFRSAITPGKEIPYGFLPHSSGRRGVRRYTKRVSPGNPLPKKKPPKKMTPTERRRKKICDALRRSRAGWEKAVKARSLSKPA